MKAKEVLALLKISRITLYRYVKQGLIKVDTCINGQYRYNEASVKAMLTGSHGTRRKHFL